MDIENKRIVYYYSCVYLPEIDQELINFLEQIKPITLEITQSTSSSSSNASEQNYSQTFEDFINDNYYYNPNHRIYLSKKYFCNADYICKTHGTNFVITYYYCKFNQEKLMYDRSAINENQISDMTPILFVTGRCWSLPHGYDTVLIKEDVYRIHIITKKKGSYTKKAVRVK